MSTTRLKRVLEEIATLPCEEQREVLSTLRREFKLHPIEAELHTSAEVILEAIQRSGELTLRMFRGVLAEAACKIEVIDRLSGWSEVANHGVAAADFVLRQGNSLISVQVKLLRSTKGAPLRADRVGHLGSPEHYVVETQKTRSGKDAEGNDTRPYQFGDFDILAVAMYPLTRRWSDFLFTPADWLVPREGDKRLIAVYQPVPPRPNDDWTSSLPECIEWMRRRSTKTISGVMRHRDDVRKGR